jgi:hypothetical protein
LATERVIGWSNRIQHPTMSLRKCQHGQAAKFLSTNRSADDNLGLRLSGNPMMAGSAPGELAVITRLVLFHFFAGNAGRR